MTEPYIPPRRRSQRNKAVVVASVILVAIASGLTWLVVDYASEQPEQVNLPGGDTFVVGDAERFAERIADQRTPLFFKDPLTAGAGRDIWVLHEGRDHEDGWYAIEAYADDAPRKLECALQWDVDAQEFTDPCSDESYEPDDDALRRYEATVNDAGKVEVDLRS